jgi:hypothetical protein
MTRILMAIPLQCRAWITQHQLRGSGRFYIQKVRKCEHSKKSIHKSWWITVQVSAILCFIPYFRVVFIHCSKNRNPGAVDFIHTPTCLYPIVCSALPYLFHIYDHKTIIGPLISLYSCIGYLGSVSLNNLRKK